MRRAFVLLSGVAAAFLTPASALAQSSDASDLQSLLDQSVVTTASKSAETSTTAPATSSTLTAEDIRRYGLHSIAEAIDFLSLGAVTSNPLGSAEIGARGVLISADSGDHFLLLIDGHAVNEPLFGAARFDAGAAIPIEMVDHIEVILGPGSVLYGSNAMLGVINVITKRAKDWHGAHLAVEGWGGPTQVDSANLAQQPASMQSKLDLPNGWQSATGVGVTAWRAMGGAGYEVPLFGKTAEITVGVEYFQQDGPAFTFGPQVGGIDLVTLQPIQYTRPPRPPTGVWGGLADQDYYVREPGGHLHIAWGNFDLGVHASIYERATPYRARFTHSLQDFNDPDSNDIDRSLWVDLKHHATFSSVVTLQSRAYADSWDYQDTQNASEASACITLPLTVTTCSIRGRFASRWVGLEEQLSFDWLKDGSLVTLVGADGRLRHVGSKIDALDFATGRPASNSIGVMDQSDYALGLYAQQTWQPVRWLGLNAGARLDEETRYTGNVSPRVAASVGAWDGATFKAIYAEAFRAPSWSETNLTDAQQLAGGSLTPERVRSVEGSFEQRFGTQRLLAGVFRSWWTDMVQLHLLTPAEIAQAVSQGLVSPFVTGDVQFRNVSSIDNYGINAAYEGSAGDAQQFRWGATATAAVARLTDPTQPGSPGVPLTVGPQVFGNARVSYDLPGDWPTLAVATHWMGKRYADRAWDGAWPNKLPVAPAQLELRATVTGPVPGIKGLNYRLSANWALAGQAPYVVGPAQDASYNEAAQLAPVDPFRAFVGLQYDLLP